MPSRTTCSGAPTLDFSYGPYGFVGFVEPFYRFTSSLAICYVFAITWVLSALLVFGLRQRWGLLWASVVSWAVLGLSWEVMRTADFASVVGLGLALAVFEAKSRERPAEAIYGHGSPGRLYHAGQAQYRARCARGTIAGGPGG